MAFVFRRPSLAPYLAAQRALSTPPATNPPSGAFFLSLDTAPAVVTGQTLTLSASRVFVLSSASVAVTAGDISLERILEFNLESLSVVITPGAMTMTVGKSINLRGIQETVLNLFARAA